MTNKHDWAGETREGWPGLRGPDGRWVPAAADTDASPLWLLIYNHVVQGAARDLLMRQVIEAEEIIGGRTVAPRGTDFRYDRGSVLRSCLPAAMVAV